MKKFLAVMLAAVMALALVACGNKNPGEENDKPGDNPGDKPNENVVSYESGVEVLEKIYGALGEDMKFPVAGGDEANSNMEGPGKFDVTLTEQMDNVLGLPAAMAEKVDDAASMLHMMNANTFTCAAYHLKDEADLTAFTDAVKENIQARQWICGMPDTLLVINAGGGYVVTVFGADDLVQAVKTAALEVLTGSEVLAEEPISDKA